MPTRADAITLLKADHRAVKDMFRRYEKLGDRAHKGRSDLVARISRELSVHAAIEEQVFYPRVREEGRRIDDDVMESLEEHHLIKEALARLQGMSPDNDRYDAAVQVLREQTEHHIKEEETELFPRVTRALDRAALVALGEAMEAARQIAPTRPHPNAPDEPPANLANTGVAAMDAARDLGEAGIEATGKAVRRARDAVVRGRPRR
jgi:hemerythrin superfamily protein